MSLLNYLLDIPSTTLLADRRYLQEWPGNHEPTHYADDDDDEVPPYIYFWTKTAL